MIRNLRSKNFNRILYESIMKDVAKIVKRHLNENNWTYTSTEDTYTYKPKTKEELRQLIEEKLKSQGPDADLNNIDVSDITDMSHLFEKLDIRNIKIDLWDVSNVTDMSEMFAYCTHFNSDLSLWDVSKVTNMYYMFACCKNFNSDLSLWDVSNVTNMYCMFEYCRSFNSDLSLWDVSNVKDMSFMFNECRNIKEPNWFRSRFQIRKRYR